MALIYCVEDDEGVRELLLCALKTGGFEPRGFQGAGELFAALSRELPALCVLDIMLPDKDGLQILAELKRDSRTAGLPVILLTAKGTEFDKVTGLEAGADDYITKPFGVMEFLSRVKAVLRRAGVPARGEQAPLAFGGLTLNSEKRTVDYQGAPVELTFKEFQLLRFLMSNNELVLSRDRIIERVWGYDYAGESRTIDMHIKSLRQKLGAAGCPECIHTVRGVGYKFQLGGAV